MEFYSEFGNFDVSITVPANYVIGASGSLQNEDELKKYKEIGQANNLANGSGLKKIFKPRKQHHKNP